MPKMPIRKVKRVGVLANKRSQFLKTHYKELRSYRPLYEKLKHNNNHLAKALSKEKQNNQQLFTQNLELVGEIQQLNLICNTRNTVISNVLNNAKEILKMLVTMTGYMTNTISMCQELAASNTAVRLSASTGNKEPSARLSTKPLAKGVVKPMVGGHTITKPTINLSRINMQNINVSRLSTIPEANPPTRSSENRSSSTFMPLRYENGHTCRLPERLTISSPRVNVTDEQRLRKKRRSHSKRLSVSFSRSGNRWSNETPTTAGHIKVIDTQIDIESQESHDTSDDHLINRINAMSESQVPINSNEKNETHVDISKSDPDVQINNKITKDFSRNSSATENSKLQNNTRTWEEEDPLEGPSWLFNNTIPSRDNEPELENDDVSDVNNNTSQVIVYDDSSATESNIGDISNLNESMNDMQTPERYPHADRSECDSYMQEHDTNDSICEILPTAAISNDKKNLGNVEDGNANDTMKFNDTMSFVTLRRGHSEAPEETEDFTLMLRPPRQNVQFDINELRLPVLEESVINNSAVNNEINTKVTATIPRVTSIPIASVSNQSLDKSDYNHITIKVPIILVGDHQRTSTSQKTKHSSNKKSSIPNMKDRTSHAENSPIKNKAKLKNKSKSNRDPSTAKVVLEKLNESHVKPNMAQNVNNVMRGTICNEDDQQDSESSSYPSSRPKRRKAPTNLKEPTLIK
ncbi:hypothetical protein ALC57_08143 [Trachymyrmex cornetzi]|uniref:Shugoshin C-terminal domain-containing protein n=2 Tax=Trachymyrmex cornetzi TaxID=471704 RepID=A0A195E435_9HYME|nr:hypothetical protein ALC57_08143 [Trachymyrmex cornetzi]